MTAGESRVESASDSLLANALPDLFDAHADDLYRYASRRVGAELAGDVVGEVFEIAIKQYGTFDAGRGVARGWLFGIANNVVRRHWRSEQRALRALARHQTRHRGDDDPFVSVDDRLDAESNVARVIDSILELSSADRDLLTMFAWERLAYVDIAEALGVPVGTVRSRIHALRKRLATGRTTGVDT